MCSTANLEPVRSLGATTVVDYTREDFSDSGHCCDLVLDAVGKRKSAAGLRHCDRALASGGRRLSVDDGRPKLLAEDLMLLGELAEQGELRPVIDRCYPLEELAEAPRYVDEGQRRGNVVIAVAQRGQWSPVEQALRAADALEVSLVAESDGEVVGHIAFSAAEIGSSSPGWFLLGPVAVRPARQGEGIGRALVETCLDALRSRGACGCVLVGDPAFYGRFGFRQYPGVTLHGVPEENVLCLLLTGEMPTGEVVHHPAYLAGT